MSFDLYLHASEDQTRKIPKPEVDSALTALADVKALSKKEYVYDREGTKVEFEVEHETAAGGDVKGIYVHVASGAGRAAFDKAKELSLALVDALGLVIYDHQAGSYVTRETFASTPVPDDGIMFRVAGRAPVYEAKASPAAGVPPAAPPAAKGGCLGVLVMAAASLGAFAVAILHS